MWHPVALRANGVLILQVSHLGLPIGRKAITLVFWYALIHRYINLGSSWLTVTGVQNELVIVKNAPHFGEMFDSDEVRYKVIAFLTIHLK